MRLFECFLLYGEEFMLSVIIKCIKMKEKKIKNELIDEEVVRYVKSTMIEECYNEKKSIRNILK